jgi:MATE family multidrug resistance protein
VLGLLFNIGANWLLVFGHGGLPALGGVGCAVSTALCMWLMLAAMVLWVRRAPAYRATDPFTHWQWPQWAPQRALLRLGLPIGITYFAEVSAFGVVSLLVARYGAVQVAAHQIALNFSSLTFMLPLSLGIALITRVGQALGQGQPARARRIAWLGVGLALACGLLSALLMVLARAQIAAAYTADPAVQALCAALLLYAALFQLSDAAQVAASSAIRGYQVTRAPMQIQLLAFWGVALPLGCWLGLGRDMAAAGFWIGLTLGLTVAAVLLSWSLARLAHARLAPP